MHAALLVCACLQNSFVLTSTWTFQLAFFCSGVPRNSFFWARAAQQFCRNFFACIVFDCNAPAGHPISSVSSSSHNDTLWALATDFTLRSWFSAAVSPRSSHFLRPALSLPVKPVIYFLFWLKYCFTSKKTQTRTGRIKDAGRRSKEVQLGLSSQA